MEAGGARSASANGGRRGAARRRGDRRGGRLRPVRRERGPGGRILARQEPLAAVAGPPGDGRPRGGRVVPGPALRPRWIRSGPPPAGERLRVPWRHVAVASLDAGAPRRGCGGSGQREALPRGRDRSRRARLEGAEARPADPRLVLRARTGAARAPRRGGAGGKVYAIAGTYGRHRQPRHLRGLLACETQRGRRCRAFPRPVGEPARPQSATPSCRSAARRPRRSEPSMRTT